MWWRGIPLPENKTGRDSKTHNRMNSYTLEVKELIPCWCKVMAYYLATTCGNISTITRNPKGFFFFFNYIFVKVHATCKHSGLIPIFWSQGELFAWIATQVTHLPLERLEPILSQSPEHRILQNWTEIDSLASPQWSCLTMVPPYPLLKQIFSNKT